MVKLHLEKKNTIVLASPVCRDFSTAGARNVNSPRAKLFLKVLEFIKAVDETNQYVAIENVPQFLYAAPESLKDILGNLNIGEYIKKFLEDLGYNVYSIHPTCNKTDKHFIQLNDVGPKEFVYLVNHANIISTNSFHAVSFSGIFDKKVLYKSYSNTESRVPTILEHYGLECEKDKPFIYNFQDADKTVMNEKIQYSKKFLKGFFEINE